MNADMKLALVVSSLFRDYPPHKPRGTVLWPGKRDILLADRALAAYFSSVAEADSWDSERNRGGLNIYAIAARLPTWRQYGQMLIDAGQVPDLKGRFTPPEE